MSSVALASIYTSNKLERKEDFETAYLAGYLRAKKHSVRVYCIVPTAPELLGSALEPLPDLLLVKFPSQEDAMRRAIAALRQARLLNVGVKIAAYGEVAVCCRTFLVEETRIVDQVINVNNNSDVDSLFPRSPDKKRKRNPLSFVPAARDLLIRHRLPFAEVRFRTGCKGHCAYCSVWLCPQNEKEDNPDVSVEEALNEIQHLVQDCGVRTVVFKDLSFEDHGARWVDEFSNGVIERRLDFNYSLHLRTETIISWPEDRLVGLALSGLTHVILGIESFLDEDLRLFRKMGRSQHALDAIDKLRKVGVLPSCSFLLLHPWTTRSNLLRNLSIAMERELLAFPMPVFNPLQLHEGLPLTTRARRDGLVVEGPALPYWIKWRFLHQELQPLGDVWTEIFSKQEWWNRLFALKQLEILACLVGRNIGCSTELELADDVLSRANLMSHALLVKQVRSTPATRSLQRRMLERDLRALEIECASAATELVSQLSELLQYDNRPIRFRIVEIDGDRSAGPITPMS